MQVATINAKSKRDDWCKGTTPTYKITNEVAVWHNGEKWFVCDKDDKDAAREISVDDLKALLAKPLTFIFWRAKAILLLLKSMGLPVPEKFECAYSECFILTGGSTRVMTIDKAFHYYWEEGAPSNDLERAFCLWWLRTGDLEFDPQAKTKYQREIENIKRGMATAEQQ